MLPYVVRRLTSSVLLLAGVSVLTFVLFFAVPQNQGYYIVGLPAHFGQTPAGMARYERQLIAANHALGVDRPLYVQYGRYLRRLAHGSLGNSFATHQPVKAMLGPALRVTAALVLGGGVLLVLLALPLGVAAALRADTVWDRAILSGTLLGAAIPPFFVSLLLVYWLEPQIGLSSTFHNAGFMITSPQVGYCPLLGGSAGCGGVRAWAMHLLLPWLAFALGIIALYARMVRAGVLDGLEAPHVQTARAKGASERRVVTSHVLRPFLPAVLTMLSMDIGMALGTVLYVEVAFGLPGVGLLTDGAILQQDRDFDLPVIAGVVLVAAVTIVVLNLLADLATAALDPRVRLTNTDA